MNIFFLLFIDVLITLGQQQSLHQPLGGSFTLHVTQCSLHFDKLQKNEIHSLVNVVAKLLNAMFIPINETMITFRII